MNLTAVVSTRCCHVVSTGQLEGRGFVLDLCLLRLGHAQEAGHRVRGFCARRRVVGEPLEGVLAGRMVRAQAEQARHDLGPEARRRTKSRAGRSVIEHGRVVAQVEHADEARVELGHRHGSRAGRLPGAAVPA